MRSPLQAGRGSSPVSSALGCPLPALSQSKPWLSVWGSKPEDTSLPPAAGQCPGWGAAKGSASGWKGQGVVQALWSGSGSRSPRDTPGAAELTGRGAQLRRPQASDPSAAAGRGSALSRGSCTAWRPAWGRAGASPGQRRRDGAAWSRAATAPPWGSPGPQLRKPSAWGDAWLHTTLACAASAPQHGAAHSPDDGQAGDGEHQQRLAPVNHVLAQVAEFQGSAQGGQRQGA